MKYLQDYVLLNKSKIFSKHDAFIAFDTTEFNQRKKSGVKYAVWEDSVFVPEVNAEVFIEEIFKNHYDAIKQDIAENGKERIICRELANYEYQVSLDIQSVIQALSGYGFTTDDIIKESKKYMQKCVNEDLF
jgi:hypothetical protein